MFRQAFAAALLCAASFPGAASAQQATITQTIAGTRLDISATGQTTRVPDVAVISAGVVSKAATASEAIQDAADRMDRVRSALRRAGVADRMDRVRSALRRAGVADRDVQTSNVSLNPEYRYADNQPPQLTGYTASNQVTVRFRDIRGSGRILDALVAQGANQISGPSLTIDKPEAALDEARANAVAIGRARAELYARSLGMHVVRLVAVSESGGDVVAPQPPMPMMMARANVETKIDPGEQTLQVNVAMTFELQ